MNPSTLTIFARVGYIAHGAVYGMLGLLAATAALSGSRPQGEKGVWSAVLEQPFGKLMLVLIGCGLLAYSIFRTVQAISDTENKGSEAHGLAHRAGAMLSAFSNAVMAMAAFGAAVPSAAKAVQGSGQHSAKSVTAEALSQPFGEWLVGFVGIMLILAGLYQISVAWGHKFTDKMRLEQMSAGQQDWATKTGVVGIVSRAMVFIVTGALVVRAGFNENPSQTGSMQAALQAIESQGSWYLLLVAAGLVAYAIYQFFLARFAKV